MARPWNVRCFSWYCVACVSASSSTVVSDLEASRQDLHKSLTPSSKGGSPKVRKTVSFENKEPRYPSRWIIHEVTLVSEPRSARTELLPRPEAS
eukprot:1028507-Rhodomonas_salina.1